LSISEGVTDELRAILLRLYNERTPEMRAKAGELFELPYTKRQYWMASATRVA
jgi:hypothetical protein